MGGVIHRFVILHFAQDDKAMDDILWRPVPFKKPTSESPTA
jgi:hypothetical protein